MASTDGTPVSSPPRTDADGGANGQLHRISPIVRASLLTLPARSRESPCPQAHTKKLAGTCVHTAGRWICTSLLHRISPIVRASLWHCPLAPRFAGNSASELQAQFELVISSFSFRLLSHWVPSIRLCMILAIDPPAQTLFIHP